MSYDVRIGSFDTNMTSNICKVIDDHIPDMGKGGGIAEIHHVTGGQAFDILSDMFDRLHDTRHRHWRDDVVGEPLFCAMYDAANGWGSLVGALIWLAQIMAACAKYPNDRVSVSS